MKYIVFETKEQHIRHALVENILCAIWDVKSTVHNLDVNLKAY